MLISLRSSFLALLGLCLLFTSRAWAQAQPVQPNAPTAQLITPGAKTKAYRIATTDKLRIAVVQESELDSIVRVDAKGSVNLKYVGEITIVGELPLIQTFHGIERLTLGVLVEARRVGKIKDGVATGAKRNSGKFGGKKSTAPITGSAARAIGLDGRQVENRESRLAGFCHHSKWML